ncbi:MAG TPA: tRNA (N6-threonylcarbamoyladenosine(37)-N6)-methyltransferase TrmO [Burkholderiales bacterium]|nr:tRNA (N6-threonylcarbamoyladenosine(37)-N6)-methyltransferase TrmO [Burkholderiales bacterium]
MRQGIQVRPIGVIRSEFKSKAGMPIQTASAPDVAGELEVFEEFAAGLRDLDGFEYLILVTHMHLAAEEQLEVVPFLDTVSRGVFATRSPNRPNRICLSIVRLLSIDGRRLRFTGNDMVDGTPVIDVKPYVPAFDVRATDRIGWFSERIDQLPGKLSDDRMR